jgi:hypothetical protein
LFWKKMLGVRVNLLRREQQAKNTLMDTREEVLGCPGRPDEKLA